MFVKKISFLLMHYINQQFNMKVLYKPRKEGMDWIYRMLHGIKFRNDGESNEHL